MKKALPKSPDTSKPLVTLNCAADLLAQQANTPKTFSALARAETAAIAKKRKKKKKVTSSSGKKTN